MKLAMMTINHDCYKEAVVDGKVVAVQLSRDGNYWKVLYEPAIVAGTFNVNASYSTIPATWCRPPDLG